MGRRTEEESWDEAVTLEMKGTSARPDLNMQGNGVPICIHMPSEETHGSRTTLDQQDTKTKQGSVTLRKKALRNKGIRKDAEEAAVLVIPNGVKALGTDPDALKKEHDSLDVDKHAFMYGRVVNKRARFNLCFGDKSQEPDYEAKKGRVVAFPDIPLTNIIRESIPTIFGPKTKGLKAEGNYYYDPKKCGIGFHGDSERMIVIAVRLGPSIPLHYQWFYKNKPVGERIKLNLYHGDMYAMSTKATGNDWKRSSIYTLRHAAGCMKFTKP